jgi:hypothetical protein
LAQEPDCVFPEQEHPSDVEIWLEGGHTVLMRVGSFGPSVEFSPEEARQLGLAFQKLADKADKADADG